MNDSKPLGKKAARREQRIAEAIERRKIEDEIELQRQQELRRIEKEQEAELYRKFRKAYDAIENNYELFKSHESHILSEVLTDDKDITILRVSENAAKVIVDGKLRLVKIETIFNEDEQKEEVCVSIVDPMRRRGSENMAMMALMAGMALSGLSML